jgi:hypothetical protein
MKVLVFAATLALIVCASALAKFHISVAASDTTPAVGKPVTFTVRSEGNLDFDLRLIAVAPGRNIFRVVATITGEVPLFRVAPDRWRGTVRFRRTGRWRVVVPNWAPAGVVTPAGVARLTITVR